MQTRNQGSSGSPFFRSNPSSNNGAGNMNWNTEAAGGVGAMDTKDLSIIQDEMHTEALLYKKCRVYADYFTDPQLKSMASTAAEHHRRHFDTLHGYLNSSN